MKITYFLGIAFVLGMLFYLPTAMTGMAIKHGNSYSLEGDFSVNGRFSEPVRLTAYGNGRLIGEGGGARIYTLTLTNWREYDSYNIYYGTPREQKFCTTLYKADLQPTMRLNCG